MTACYIYYVVTTIIHNPMQTQIHCNGLLQTVAEQMVTVLRCRRDEAQRTKDKKILDTKQGAATTADLSQHERHMEVVDLKSSVK
jgi:hypothetical protein